jgi:hypothetical protein
MPHGAPAKTLRRNVLELTTSRPPTCKIVGENRSRPRPDETSVREMDAYPPCAVRELNSLIPAKNSLLLEIFSLLIFVGNLPGNRCGTGAFRTDIASKSPEIAKFPVKFPVSRELQAETGSYLTAHTTIPSKWCHLGLPPGVFGALFPKPRAQCGLRERRPIPSWWAPPICLPPCNAKFRIGPRPSF